MNLELEPIELTFLIIEAYKEGQNCPPRHPEDRELRKELNESIAKQTDLQRKLVAAEDAILTKDLEIKRLKGGLPLEDQAS